MAMPDVDTLSERVLYALSRGEAVDGETVLNLADALDEDRETVLGALEALAARGVAEHAPGGARGPFSGSWHLSTPPPSGYVLRPVYQTVRIYRRATR